MPAKDCSVVHASSEDLCRVALQSTRSIHKFGEKFRSVIVIYLQQLNHLNSDHRIHSKQRIEIHENVLSGDSSDFYLVQLDRMIFNSAYRKQICVFETTSTAARS